MPLPSRTRLAEVSRLAAPVVLGQVSTILVSFSDAWMVGRLPGEEGRLGLAALGACSTPFLVAFLVFSSLSQGVQIISSRRLGEGRDREIGAVLTSGLALALCIGLAASALGWVVAPLVSTIQTGNEVTQGLAQEYLQMRWGGGMWLVVLAFTFRGFYWGTGLTRTDLLVSLVFNLTNVFLNWVFIFGHLGAERMGVPGAGLASACANGVSVLLFTALTFRQQIRERFAPFVRGSFQPDLARRIFRLSLPRALQAAAFTMSVLFFAIVQEWTGDDGMAASGVIWRFLGFTVLVGIGIGTAASTLVGRSLGAGRTEDAIEYGRAAVWVGMCAVGALAVIGAIFARPLLTEFLGDERPALVAMALPAFKLMLAFQVVDSIGIVLSRALQGAGDVLYVMYAEFVIAWGTCLPVAWFGAQWLAATDPLLGVWFGWAAYTTGWALAMGWRWRSRRWQGIRV